MSVPQIAEGAMLRIARGGHSVTIDVLSPPGGLLAIIPHPDDETLGCGQAFAAAACGARRIGIVLVTDGEGADPDADAAARNRMACARGEELTQALALLAPDREVAILRLRLPDGRSERSMVRPQMFEQVIAFARSLDTQAVWSTWRGDPHCDHVTAALLARRLCERIRRPHWSFPVWGRFGERDVPPQLHLFHDPRFLARKRLAIEAYRSQIVSPDDPESRQFTLPRGLAEHFKNHPEIFIREQ